MYVTNLTPTRLGISGPIVLSPHEKNRYLDESNAKIMAAVMRLKAGNFVSYVLDAGLTKTAPAMSVKTLAIDVSAIGNKPKVITSPKVEAKEALNDVKTVNKEAADSSTKEEKTVEQVSETPDKKPRKSRKTTSVEK